MIDRTLLFAQKVNAGSGLIYCVYLETYFIHTQEASIWDLICI